MRSISHLHAIDVTSEVATQGRMERLAIKGEVKEKKGADFLGRLTILILKRKQRKKVVSFQLAISGW